jgi:hypothetical protein
VGPALHLLEDVPYTHAAVLGAAVQKLVGCIGAAQRAAEAILKDWGAQKHDWRLVQAALVYTSFSAWCGRRVEWWVRQRLALVHQGTARAGFSSLGQLAVLRQSGCGRVTTSWLTGMGRQAVSAAPEGNGEHLPCWCGTKLLDCAQPPALVFSLALRSQTTIARTAVLVVRSSDYMQPALTGRWLGQHGSEFALNERLCSCTISLRCPLSQG